jgi:hypothetical protein
VARVPAPPVTTVAAASCAATQLEVVLERLEPTTGNGYGHLRTRNRGEVACTLAGTATRACVADELVAGIDGPEDGASDGDEEPTGTVWVTAIGTVPCLVDPALELHGPDGERFVAAQPAASAPGRVVLRPADGIRARLPWSEIERALTAPDPTAWSVRTGDGVPALVVARPAVTSRPAVPSGVRGAHVRVRRSRRSTG